MSKHTHAYRLSATFAAALLVASVDVSDAPRAMAQAVQENAVTVPVLGERAVTDADLAARLRVLYWRRLLAAKHEVDVWRHEYKAGLGGLAFLSLNKAERRLAEAELDLCETPVQRIAVCQHQVEVARETERIYGTMSGIGRVRATDYCEAVQDRLCAEIELLRELIRSRQPAKPVSVLVPNCDPGERSAIAALEALGATFVLESEKPGAHAVEISFRAWGPLFTIAPPDVGTRPSEWLDPTNRLETASPRPIRSPSSPDEPVTPAPGGLEAEEGMGVPGVPWEVPRDGPPPPPLGDPGVAPAPSDSRRQDEPEFGPAYVPRAPVLQPDDTLSIPEERMRRIAELKHLRCANFIFVNVNDAGLSHLAGLTELRELCVGGPITDAGLKHLTGLTKLRSLYLSGGSVNDAGLSHLAGLTELRELSVGGPITDAGLKHLTGLTKLRSLYLSGGSVNDAGLSHLAGLSELRDLYVGGPITDAGLKHLTGLTKLQTLRLFDANVNDAGLSHLAGLTELRELCVAGPITDAGLEHLKGLKNLGVLQMNCPNVTKEGRVRLKAALPILTQRESELLEPPPAPTPELGPPPPVPMPELLPPAPAPRKSAQFEEPAGLAPAPPPEPGRLREAGKSDRK